MYRDEKRRVTTVKEAESLYGKSNWQKNILYWQNEVRELEMSNKKDSFRLRRCENLNEIFKKKQETITEQNSDRFAGILGKLGKLINQNWI